VLGVLGTNVPPYLRSGGEDLNRGVSSGVNDFPTNPIEYPYTQPLPKLDGLMQVKNVDTNHTLIIFCSLFR